MREKVKEFFNNIDYSDIFLITIFCSIVAMLVTAWLSMPEVKNSELMEMSCHDLKKFYKDDILFDNYYITCSTTEVFEVPTLDEYLEIVEGRNYTIRYVAYSNELVEIKEDKNENTNENN